MDEEEDLAKRQAEKHFRRAYKLQQRGQLTDAILLYKRSIAAHPTAEAHTFLGWVYGMLRRYDEAIAQCKQAIKVDPTFGNPYNDIGSYLIEMGQPETAIPWLQKALTAPRYGVPQFPRINLGRAYEKLGQPYEALKWYDAALAIDSTYVTALWAKWLLLGKLN